MLVKEATGEILHTLHKEEHLMAKEGNNAFKGRPVRNNSVIINHVEL